jgi:hypothetical protein
VLDVNRPGPDYSLRWPRELFVQEASVLGATAGEGHLERSGRMAADRGLRVHQAGERLPQSTTKSTWTDQDAGRQGAAHLHQPALFLQALIGAAPRLPEQTTPRLYYAARHGRQPTAPLASSRPDPAAARRDWLIAIASLRRNGYLADVPRGRSAGRSGLFSGGHFCLDIWQLRRLGLVGDTGLFVSGVIGVGKSSLGKTIVTRDSVFGRPFVVPCDIRGEWVPVVQALEGTVLRLGPACRTGSTPWRCPPGRRASARRSGGWPCAPTGRNCSSR